MASLTEQKKAQLAKKRNNLMDLVFDAKMKRANEVRVIKDFVSVVTFLDHEDDLPVLDKSAVKKQVIGQSKVQPKEMVLPVVKQAVESSALAEVEEKTVEVIGSDYWDKKYK
jgi:hypothetical protein